MEKTYKNHIVNHPKALFKELMKYCNTCSIKGSHNKNEKGQFEIDYKGNHDTYHFKDKNNYIKYWMDASEFIMLVHNVSLHCHSALGDFKKISLKYIPKMGEDRNIIKFKLKL